LWEQQERMYEEKQVCSVNKQEYERKIMWKEVSPIWKQQLKKLARLQLTKLETNKIRSQMPRTSRHK
jgi:hypothetical protein